MRRLLKIVGEREIVASGLTSAHLLTNGVTPDMLGEPGRWLRRVVQSAVCITVVSGVFGCGGGDGEPVVVDLIEELPAAEVLRETPVLDLGTAEARSHLGVGWSGDETRKDGLTMVWATGEVSEVKFFLAEPRDVDVAIRCSPVPHPDGDAQRVRVSVKGRRLAEVELEPGLRDHVVLIPADAVSAGTNTLELGWAHALVPSSAGQRRENRRLAARCDEIRIGGSKRPRRPLVLDRDLVISPGVQLNYYLPLPNSTAFGVEKVEVPDDSSLEITWQVDGSDEEPLVSWSEDVGPTTVAITNPGRGPLRLGFRVAGDGGEVILRGPRVQWIGRPQHDETSEAPAVVESPPNILMYLVDTLRADRLGCYGWTESLTPNLDNLSFESVTFDRAIAQTSWTKPSVASIFTGIGPGRHGVNGKRSKLPESAITMAELLAGRGYDTAGFASNAYITRPAGFGQGFEDFSFQPARSRETTDEAIAWLRSIGRDRPFFLYVHTVDPHAPYDPSSEFRDRFAAGVTDPLVGTVDHIRSLAAGRIAVTERITSDMLRLYEAEVAENDHSFGRLMGVLGELGLLEDTLIIFLSDHGEEFDEHGVFGHGWDLYREVLHMPLIIRPPGGTTARRFEGVVQHVDLLPTVLEAAGISGLGGLEGRSLWPVVNGNMASADPRPVFSYLDYEGRRGLSVELDGLKLIEPLSSGFLAARELYNVGQDPFEQDSVADVLPVTAGYLASLARVEFSDYGSVEAADELPSFDADTRRALEALGYIR